MGPRAFSKTSGVSIEEAKKFMTEYFTSFPAVSVWQEKIKESAKRDGYVKNVHGRRRLFSEDRFQELERAIINMPLQSFGADIMKKSIISVSSLIETGGYSNTVFPLLTIHDELLLEVKNDIINVISTKIKQCMEDVEHISVPLVVDVKVGTLWGSMESFPNTHE